MTSMLNRLGQALMRLWRSLSHRPGEPDATSAVAMQSGSDETRRSNERRSRFWAELREGQREADALCAKVRP